MRVVVTGATGNVGTSVLAALSADPAIDEIVGRPAASRAVVRAHAGVRLAAEQKCGSSVSGSAIRV
jgi:uncharacterized protein YbjT (DUF2867 family)